MCRGLYEKITITDHRCFVYFAGVVFFSGARPLANIFYGGITVLFFLLPKSEALFKTMPKSLN